MIRKKSLSKGKAVVPGHRHRRLLTPKRRNGGLRSFNFSFLEPF